MPKKSMTTISKTTGPELFRIIRQEHKTVMDLFNEFEKAAEGEKMEEAASIAMTIIIELKGHTSREEQIVYPRLKEVDEDMFFEAHEEHKVAKTLMSEIENMSAEEETYIAKVTVLQDVIEHHVEEEHGEMFGALRELPAATLRQCAEQWKQQKAAPAMVASAKVPGRQKAA